MELIVDFPQDKDTLKPRIRFADCKETKFVEDITFKYKIDLFYSACDIQSFKLRTAHQVYRLREIGPDAYLDPRVDTAGILGPEKCLTEETYQASLCRRETYSKAVISEQERQLRLGIHDAHALAVISERASRTSTLRAHSIALLHTT